MPVSKYVRQWQHGIKQAATVHWDGDVSLAPMIVVLTFQFVRPMSHYYARKNGNVLREYAPKRMICRPDADKLVRAVLDGLTYVVMRDDSQVVALVASKVYGKRNGVDILIAELED